MAVKLPKGFCARCGTKLAGLGKWCDAHRPPSKYGNRKVGKIDSEKEHGRGFELANLQRAGVVRNLKERVPFPLAVNGTLVCTYYADFTYEILTKTGWVAVVEDVKGFRTRYYKTVAKLFFAVMGFRITET